MVVPINNQGCPALLLNRTILTHTATSATKTVVVELEYFEREAGGASEERGQRFDSIRTKRIVTEIQLCEVGISLHHSLTKSSLGKWRRQDATTTM